MTERLAEKRRDVGLTQAQLAEAAGVSRSLVAAVEAGRHAPSVRTALELARCLGGSVEELFGRPPPPPARPLLEKLPPGSTVRAVRVGDEVVYTPLGEAAGLLEAADGWLDERGRLELYPQASLEGLLVAGCEPSIGLMSRLLPSRGPRRLLWAPATSESARRALLAGRAHAAAVHGRSGDLEGAPETVERIRLGRWQVGLAFLHGQAVSLEELARRGEWVAQGRPGAAAQAALGRALASAGLDAGRLAGGTAGGHVEAAHLLLRGAARAALTISPVAAACRLDFEPLETHAVELWLFRSGLAEPGPQALTELLHSSAYRRRLSACGGYDLA